MTALGDLIRQDSPLILWEMQEASGNAIDSSGNGRDGTVNAATYQAAGPSEAIPYAYEFATKGGYVRRAIDAGLQVTGDRTMGVWLNSYAPYPSFNGGDQLFCLGQAHTSHASPYYTNLWNFTTTGWSWFIAPGGAFQGGSDPSKYAGTSGCFKVWHFYVTSWRQSDGLMSFYKDGVLVGTDTEGAGLATGTSTQPWGLGYANPNLNNGYSMHGKFTHAFMHGTVISAERVAAYYQASLTPKFWETSEARIVY